MNIPSFLIEAYANGTISEATYKRITNSKGSEPHMVSLEVRKVLELEEIPQIPAVQKQPFWKVSTVYCGSRSGDTLLSPLEKIGQKEGFKADRHPVTCDWVRDISYAPSSKEWIVPAKVTHKQMSGIKAKSVPLCKIMLSKGWGHQFLGEIAFKNMHNRWEFYKDFNQDPDLSIKFSELYFQGGNILKAEDKNGTKCHLVGVYNVVASHFLLERPISEIQELFQKTFSDKTVICGLEHLEQLSYHLDISMLPLMGGKVLIQDHEETVRLLEQLIGHPEVTRQEKQQFTLYLHDARQLAAIERDKLEHLKAELSTAGFEPVSISGSYYGGGENAINYINALHGYGSENHSFVITFDYEIPGEKYLQGYFTHRLQQAGVENIYFVPSNKASEMILDGGGLHCDTFEI